MLCRAWYILIKFYIHIPLLILSLDTGMHSGDKASPSINLAGCCHLVMKTSTCFKESYSLIVSYSLAVSDGFESKSDFYFLLIIVGLIYLDKNNL